MDSCIIPECRNVGSGFGSDSFVIRALLGMATNCLFIQASLSTRSFRRLHRLFPNILVPEGSGNDKGQKVARFVDVVRINVNPYMNTVMRNGIRPIQFIHGGVGKIRKISRRFRKLMSRGSDGRWRRGFRVYFVRIQVKWSWRGYLGTASWSPNFSSRSGVRIQYESGNKKPRLWRMSSIGRR